MQNDGESKLLVADSDKLLKIYKGQHLFTELALLEQPSALAVFYPDTASPQLPSVAVGGGSFVFIYRNLKPAFKFTLPPVDITPEETAIWAGAKNGTLTGADVVARLADARSERIWLSARSVNLLNIADEGSVQTFVDLHKNLPLVQLTILTCMTTIYKNREDDRSVGQLVIGMESKSVIVLDPLCLNVVLKVDLPAVPVSIAVLGAFEVDYRLAVACRNGSIYTIKKGKLMPNPVELESQAVGMVMGDKSLYVACMDQMLHSYQFKGGKSFSLQLPAPVSTMAPMHVRAMRNVRAFVVALTNGEVRVYNHRTLVSTLKLKDMVTACTFGQYGREDCALAMAFKSGGLSIKYLQRQVKLDLPVDTGINDQDVPLKIPKKTKLFVDQKDREREQAVDMHRVFQRDLCRLRLSAARAYVKVITGGEGPLSSVGNANLRLDVKVQGLGPLFKLKLSVKNTSEAAIVDIPVALHFNSQIYRVISSCHKIPCLVPGLSYQYEMMVENIDPAGVAGQIRVFICNPKSCMPAISAVVMLPMSEQPLTED